MFIGGTNFAYWNGKNKVVEVYARMFLVLDLGVGSTYRQFLFSQIS